MVILLLGYVWRRLSGRLSRIRAIQAEQICNKLYFLFICGEVKGAVMELDEASVKRGTLVME